MDPNKPTLRDTGVRPGPAPERNREDTRTERASGVPPAPFDEDSMPEGMSAASSSTAEAAPAPRTNKRSQLDETFDDDAVTEGMSSASEDRTSNTTYAGTPNVTTTGRESSAGLEGIERSGGTGEEEGVRGGTRSYWDNEGPGPRIMAADTLEGDKVVNGAGEDLGEIKDIMIDVPSGRVAYAVLSFGGFLGMGDKLFAIPWQALQLDPPNHRFILDVDKEQLSTAPGFDKDHWPSMADQRWAVEIHEYYGSRPYWE